MSDKEQVKAEQATELQSVSIGDFEVPLLKGDYASAEKVLQILMYNQRFGKMEFNLRPGNRTLNLEQINNEAYQIIEKLATLITKMFSDPKYIPSAVMFKEYVMGKKFIAYLFTSSSYQNTDHIIRNLGLDTKGNYTKEDIRKFLISYIPESTFDLPWVKLANHMPAEVSQAYLGLMSSISLLLSETANNQIQKLALVAKEMPLITFARPGNLELMTSGYFHVSNLAGTDKYEYKKWAAKNYLNFMQSFLSDNLKQAIVNKALKKLRKGKKKILIIHEHYRRGHAMYRCYHSLISGLKDEFDVIGLSDIKKVDDLGKQDHHSFIEYDDIYDFEKVINGILEVQPDIIIYPSLGMSNYAPLLASVRLAPIQCVCPGHPSSSYIETVDYLLLEDMGLSNQELTKIATEQTVVIQTEGLKVVPIDYTLKDLPVDSKVLNIAINGVIQKISFSLLNICKAISDGIDKEVVFHFFMSNPLQDLDYYAAKSTLRRALPNSTSHPYSHYDNYMNTIALCEFALPTMPFGGANSNIDVARLGIPKLFVKNTDDLPGVTDYYMWKELGVLHCLCDDANDLIKRAIEFGNDEEKLKEAKELIRTINIESFMTKEDHNKHDLRLVKAINSLIN